MRRTEVYERINRCRILVGTVASISGKPELFRLKHFDVAIVDEATQILEPQLLGILCAKGENGKEGVGKFILIGDHKQLPAVVLQNSEQSEVYDEALSAVGLKNLKDSLFERLYRTARQHTDAHRTYDMLCRQGRMHPKWLCSPIKLSMKVGCCLSDCRINWKIPEISTGCLSILRSPNRWVLLLKQTIRKQRLLPV